VRALDEFLDPYWNLEQVRSWAETRNAEAVRFAAIPKQGKPKHGSEIAAFCIHAATTLAKNGRDVGAEPWAASGWTPPSQIFVPPPMAQKLADEIGFPIYLLLFNKDIQIHLPKREHTDALLTRWMAAHDSERALTCDLVQAYSKNEDGFRSDPRLGQLSPELRHVAIDYFSAPEPHGPPHVFIRGTFPTVSYLERLFQTGALKATANRPNEPKAYEISKNDWAGLEIACGGDLRRLGVWRRGQVSVTGEGDFENVRVEREAVLKAFPADVAPCPAIDATPETVGQASNEHKRKPSKAMAAAQALTQLFPNGRPTLTGPELIRELTTKAPEIGTVSIRTLTRAISSAWPTIAPKPAK
jgi:hypothetical protein